MRQKCTWTVPPHPQLQRRGLPLCACWLCWAPGTWQRKQTDRRTNKWNINNAKKHTYCGSRTAEWVRPPTPGQHWGVSSRACPPPCSVLGELEVTPVDNPPNQEARGIKGSSEGQRGESDERERRAVLISWFLFFGKRLFCYWVLTTPVTTILTRLIKTNDKTIRPSWNKTTTANKTYEKKSFLPFLILEVFEGQIDHFLDKSI